MENLKIVQATLNDANKLQQIGRDTFSETFSNDNDEEEMKRYLDNSFSVAKLTGELNNPQSQFYFALLDEQLIGYLKVNTGQAQTELKAEDGLEIERIYVLHAHHGKKVGQALYEKAIHIATDLKVNYVWLGVWEENVRALRFYTKNGFVPFDKHIFRLGNDEQTDIMMKKNL